MAYKLRFRRDTSANWSSVNPVLGQGEPALDLTNSLIKIGDGSTAWNDLPYYSPAPSGPITTAWGSITGNISVQTDLQAALNNKQDTINAFNNQLIYQDNEGVRSGVPNLFYNPVSQGLNQGVSQSPDGEAGNQAINNFSLNISPISDSPNFFL